MNAAAMCKRSSSPRASARGGASLIVVMGLLLTLMLAAAYAGRGVLVEQKVSAAQYHGTQAFEAAEAGLEWTLAQLNGGRLDAHCAASSDTAQTSLREKTLRPADANSGAYAVAPPPGSVGLPGCVRNTTGDWQCQCPASGNPSFDASADDGIRTAFRVELTGAAPAGSASAYPGVVQLRAHACAGRIAAGVPCSGGSDAVATIAEQVALIPALATPPAATLTAQGSVDAGSDGAGLHNDQPGGLIVDAAADALLGTAQLSAAPGTSASDAVVRNDGAWAADTAAQHFLALFGVPQASYAQLPAVVALHCPPDCTDTLRAALDRGARLLWVDNDLVISALDIGSADAPVMLVAAGALHFDGNVRCTGLVYGRGWQWNGGQSGQAWLHGAAVIDGDVQLSGAPDLGYDASALAVLHARAGSFVRVPGSWSDGA
jgi:hypothetical protein